MLGKSFLSLFLGDELPIAVAFKLSLSRLANSRSYCSKGLFLNNHEVRVSTWNIFYTKVRHLEADALAFRHILQVLTATRMIRVEPSIERFLEASLCFTHPLH